jgi:Telomere resolvase
LEHAARRPLTDPLTIVVKDKSNCEPGVRSNALSLAPASLPAPVAHDCGSDRPDSRYRMAVRAALGESHPALRYLKPSIDDQAAVKEAQLQKSLADQTDLRPIDGEDLTDRAIALLDHRAAAALMLLTGRRKIEILRTGHLSAVPAGTALSENAPAEHTLVFDGQAKTRGAVSAQTAPYPIPVLAKPQLVLDAFARLRDSYDCAYLTNEQVHNRTSKTLNGYVAQFFSDDAGNAMMPKDLRAAYATIAWEWFAPPHIAQSAYIARILGHSELDLVTVQSYIDFYPLGHKRDFQRAYRAGLRDAINQLAQLTQAETDERKRLQLEERRA